MTTRLAGARAKRFEALVAPLNRALAERGQPPVSAELLGERAALLGLSAPGRVSANGSCRLIACADGWMALNLARPEDIELLPALLEQEVSGDPWIAVEACFCARPAARWLERAAWLGLPLSQVGEGRTLPAVRSERLGDPARAPARPLVVDLSSLWAGPLCGQLLGKLGARVIKARDRRRLHAPTGAARDFHRRLEVGKAVRLFDFTHADDRAALRALVDRADVVIEASRPRALAQLGLDPEAMVRARPGKVWVSLTAYGRGQPSRAGFGDDAAAAGGLVDWDISGAPVFVGDAIADPLSGLAAARAVLEAWDKGGGVLLDVAMAGAAAEIAGPRATRRPTPAGADLLLRGVELRGRKGLDVAVRGGRVTAIGARLALKGVEEIDARGGALLPGLCDHHLHLFAAAAALRSTPLGPDDVKGPAGLARAIAAADAALPEGEWLRGTGYHDSVAGPLDRQALDKLAPDRPARVQYATGSLWVLNSQGLARLSRHAPPPGAERDAAGRLTGRFFREDAWLRRALPADPPPRLERLAGLLSAYGVTAVTDASVTTDQEAAETLVKAARAAGLRQRLTLMSGGALSSGEGFAVGPVKLLLDDARLAGLEPIIEAIALARRQGRAVAVHCVTAGELAFALAAWGEAGARAGDRVEHGGIINASAAQAIAELGLTVVTQPGFIFDRGDRYLAEVDPLDQPHLYPCASLIRRRVKVAAGSDAPYGPLDPWLAMRAAVDRITRHGQTLGEAERVPRCRALALHLGAPDAPAKPQRIAVGAPADFCLTAAPLKAVLAELSSELVAETIVGGVPAPRAPG